MSDEKTGQKLEDPRNPYASQSRWRHQESSAYARYAAVQHQQQPRDPTASDVAETAPLANFLNKDRVEGEGAGPGGAHQHIVTGVDDETQPNLQGGGGAKTDGKEIVCGPLLNYRGMSNRRWRGSVLVVVAGGGPSPPPAPTLVLRRAGAVDRQCFVPMSEKDNIGGQVNAMNGNANGNANGDANGHASAGGGGVGVGGTNIEGACLFSDPRNTFWAFDIEVDFEQSEVKWEYTVPGMRYSSSKKPQTNSFFVPALGESMRVMFHSCNGFSVGTDEEAFNGPCLWHDVNRRHKEAPFHVMIGGGDQIYNDGIRVNGPLRPWTDIQNPRKRSKYQFPESLRKDCDDYYLKNYIEWYNTEPFATANGQIAQLNIWDDHDIIDGFGSYVDSFMKCDVFRGIGGTAHKYYVLFQHHLPPPPSTYTTDHAATTIGGEAGQGVDPNQLKDVYIGKRKAENETGFIVGQKPGPYVAEQSLNLWARLGSRIGFIGIDARTERTRHQINYPETYKLIFDRLKAELSKARDEGEPITHLLILLGVPIAYPRLTWLENIFRSPLMGPLKFLNRRFGVGGSLFNKFDGSIDLLDDLDDHWTAKTHKKERTELIESLQAISRDEQVRMTILSGDVHLAALGRFYSDGGFQQAATADERYMVNVVSSAIVNKPPPTAIANILAHRNKVHFLGKHTTEVLMDLFDKDPGDAKKTSGSNCCTMPSRNYAMITENSPNNNGVLATQNDGGAHALAPLPEEPVRSWKTDDGRKALCAGEVGAGTKHKAAHTGHGRHNDGSIDVCIRVEIDQSNPEGRTQGYGLTVPKLTGSTNQTNNGAPAQ